MFHLQADKDKRVLGAFQRTSLAESFNILNESSYFFMPLLVSHLLGRLIHTTSLFFPFTVMYTSRLCQTESIFISFHFNLVSFLDCLLSI